MIKLNNIPEEIMDVVMPISRSTGRKPDEVIKIMLRLVTLDEAMRAINDEYKVCKNPAKT